LTAVACFAVVTAAAGLAGVLTAAPSHVIGSLSALLSLGLLEVSPRLAILLAGLSPMLTSALDPDVTERLPTADLLTTTVNRADNSLTSLLAAFSASAAAGAIVTALMRNPESIAFATVAGALLLLRARTADRRRRLVFTISGTTIVATTFAIAAANAPQYGPWTAAVTALLGAVPIYLGSVAPTVLLSPFARRSIKLLECVALVAIVPMTCWICGVFSAVRGLNLI
jgi:type VII secretion integral membrane protein EccD